MQCLKKVIFLCFAIISLIPACRNEILQSFNLTSTDCKITEPMYNKTFDLNGLSSDLAHKIHGANVNEFIEFNVCGDMIKTCNGKSHTSACYHRAGKEEVIGIGSQLSLIDGRLLFNFAGEKCNQNETYKLEIILICDYSTIKEPLNLIPHSDKQCTFFITWRTKLACFALSNELESNTCTVKDESNQDLFNLTPLSQFNHRIPDRNGSSFIINICKPTMYGHQELCPPGSSVCHMTDLEMDMNKRYVNYGTTASKPVYEDKKLLMRFTSDTNCSASKNYSSIINFNCDSTMDGEPEYIGKRDCEYQFSWPTRYACDKFHTCTTIDPVTGFTYDLSSLANKEYSVEQNGTKYIFGICNAASTTCKGKSSGSCKMIDGQTTGLGQFNDNLRYNETGSPYLVYTSGASCKGLARQWSTKIEFLCAANGVTQGARLIEDSDCEIIIQYVTDLVCHKEINCKAFNWIDNVEIDLTQLINVNGNYLASINDTLKRTEGDPTVYYINVCRPLVPQYGLSCPGGSAACRATKSTVDMKPTNEQSLGFPDVSLTVVNTSVGARVQLKYLRGSVCPTDAKLEMSSTIEFYCDVKAGKGVPILQEITDCEYKFDWPTNVICPQRQCEFREKTCEIYNDQTDVALDLKRFTDDGLGKISINHNGGTFGVNVCGNDRKVETDYAQGTTKIFFKTEGPCQDSEFVNVELRLECKASEKNHSWTDITLCGVVLIKETPNICNFIGIAIEDNGSGSKTKPLTVVDASSSNSSDDGSLFIGAIIILVCILLIGVIVVNVYLLRNPDRRQRLKTFFTRRNVAVQYTRVRSDEEANLLLSQPDRLSDSDDELIV